MHNRFTQLFIKKANGFIPFFMLGYPTIEKSVQLIESAITAGCDALELGFPFSDPVADGPVIEASARIALKNGATFQKCCEAIQQIRANHEIPIGLLLYYNVLLQQGDTAYQTLADIGVDAVLVVDLPLEESQAHEAQLAKHQLGCVQLITPNSSTDRCKALLSRSTAFAYVVSRFGTTGTRDRLSDTLAPRLQALKTLSDCPLVVGFGLRTAQQVQTVFASGAQGAIIGSQFTKWITENSDQAQHQIRALIQSIQEKN